MKQSRIRCIYAQSVSVSDDGVTLPIKYTGLNVNIFINEVFIINVDDYMLTLANGKVVKVKRVFLSPSINNQTIRCIEDSISRFNQPGIVIIGDWINVGGLSQRNLIEESHRRGSDMLDNRCFWCSYHFSIKNRDHIIPKHYFRKKSMPVFNNFHMNNIVNSCIECNSEKNSLSLSKFYSESLRKLSETNNETIRTRYSSIIKTIQSISDGSNIFLHPTGLSKPKR